MFCGCRDEYKTHSEMRKVLTQINESFPNGTCPLTAREYMQYHTNAVGCDQLPPPDPVANRNKWDSHQGGPIPTQPNVYSDGSLKHPRGIFWQVGGAGVWWPKRSLTEVPIIAAEENIRCTNKKKAV